MNLQQIIMEVNKDIDDMLDNATLTGWINRSLDIISVVAKYEKRVKLIFEDEVGDYPLPHDILKLFYVIGDAGIISELKITDRVSAGYKRWGNTIGFQNINDTSSVDMYYHARLPHLENPQDEPAIPLQFHDLCVLYTAGRAKYKDEEESMQNNVFGEFNRRLEDLRKHYAQQETYEIESIYNIF